MKTLFYIQTFTFFATSGAIAVDFDKDIKPILETRCVSCHGIEKKKGDLDLSNLLSANKGGENGKDTNGPIRYQARPRDRQIDGDAK